MTMMVLDTLLSEHLSAEREASGADRYDEVWDGVYVMAPLADDQHQNLQGQLVTIFTLTIAWPGLGEVRGGVNVSDRETKWRTNFRIPDVAIFLKGTSARNSGTHWVGGPDFAVEIASSGDLIDKKLGFYSAVGVRELLVIERDPWALQLYRKNDDELRLVSSASPEPISSEVIPLGFRLDTSASHPRIEVTHHDGKQRWLV